MIKPADCQAGADVACRIGVGWWGLERALISRQGCVVCDNFESLEICALAVGGLNIGGITSPLTPLVPTRMLLIQF